MRTWLTGVLAASMMVLGLACGGDDNGTPDSGVTGDGGTGDGGGDGKPVITRVTWSTPDSCRSGTASVYTVAIMATDSNTASDQLTFTGTLTGCTPGITAATQMITCPNTGSYLGRVTAKDPEGNESPMFTFTVSPCSSGMAP
jgi:hypothetical protein